MKKIALTMIVAASLAVAGCQQATLNKENVGMGLGALAGGLAGSQMGKGSGRLWATGAGVLLGGLLGSNIGASLDKADMAYAQQAASRANTAPIGQQITWNNPQTGNSGSYTPVRDGRDQAGRYCREYQQTVTVGGRKETAYGTACQSPNGDWEIVN
jgi:surface antigen